jgi:HSP20 family protein
MNTSSESSGNNPDTPVDKLREVVASLIDVVATQGNRAIDTLGLRTPGRNWLPNVDVIEGDDHVLVVADLPGIDTNAVEILLAGNMLTIKGNQKPAELPPGWTLHRRERPTGAFARSIPLPISVNREQVSAEARNGVLTVRLAKEERHKARQIPIQARG